MVPIFKQGHPPKLGEYKSKATKAQLEGDSAYDSLPSNVKDDIRLHLANEQHYLCAYCMRRIEAAHDKMKIEHFDSQELHPKKSLDYTNMLGVCYGTIKGTTGTASEQTCDTKRGSQPMAYNPSQSTHHAAFNAITYSRSGELLPDEKHSGLSDQIGEEVLNLNNPVLMGNRAAIFVSFERWCKSFVGAVPVAELNKKLQKFLVGPKREEYIGVWQYLLNKKIKAITGQNP